MMEQGLDQPAPADDQECPKQHRAADDEGQRSSATPLFTRSTAALYSARPFDYATTHNCYSRGWRGPRPAPCYSTPLRQPKAAAHFPEPIDISQTRIEPATQV